MIFFLSFLSSLFGKSYQEKKTKLYYMYLYIFFMIFNYIALSHGQIVQITLVEKITIISMKFLPNKCQSVKELLAKITVEKLTMFICNSVRRYPNYVHITVSTEIIQSSELRLTIKCTTAHAESICKKIYSS